MAEASSLASASGIFIGDGGTHDVGTPTGDCCGGAWTHGAGYLGPEHAGVRLNVDPKNPVINTRSFGEDPLLQVGAQAAVSQHFDSTSEELFEILLEPDHIQQRSARLDIDEKVGVAEWPSFTANR